MDQWPDACNHLGDPDSYHLLSVLLLRTQSIKKAAWLWQDKKDFKHWLADSGGHPYHNDALPVRRVSQVRLLMPHFLFCTALTAQLNCELRLCRLRIENLEGLKPRAKLQTNSCAWIVQGQWEVRGKGAKGRVGTSRSNLENASEYVAHYY